MTMLFFLLGVGEIKKLGGVRIHGSHIFKNSLAGSRLGPEHGCFGPVMLTQHAGTLRLLLRASSLSLPGRARQPVAPTRPSHSWPSTAQKLPRTRVLPDSKCPRGPKNTRPRARSAGEACASTTCLTGHPAGWGSTTAALAPLQTFSASQESQHIHVQVEVLHPTFPKEQKDNLIQGITWAHWNPTTNLGRCLSSLHLSRSRRADPSCRSHL